MWKCLLWFVAFIGSCMSPVHSQKSKGFFLTYFSQDLGTIQLDVDYSYQSLSLQYSESGNIIGSSSFSLDWELLPQIGLTNVKNSHTSHSSENGVEIGIVPGIILRKSLFSKTLMFYLGGGIGLKYVSAAPDQQKSGFLFSNTVFAGSNVKLKPSKYLALRFGFRHQSNGSLSQPNRGINALYLGVGFLFYNIPP